jgi:hypothetical protein
VRPVVTAEDSSQDISSAAMGRLLSRASQICNAHELNFKLLTLTKDCNTFVHEFYKRNRIMNNEINAEGRKLSTKLIRKSRGKR